MRKNDPYNDHKPIHLAILFSQNGNASALCFAKPKAISLKVAKWTITQSQVTCKKCIAKMQEWFPATGSSKAASTLIYAGEDLPRAQMVVVDEETWMAYAHPKTKTLAGRIKIYGRTVAAYQKGEAISLREWWLDEEINATTVAPHPVS